MPLMKSIFEYDNYREFLKDFYKHSKTHGGKFSLGYFSKMAGFKSRSVLRQVMAGERNIALHSIEKFIKALKLNRREGEYFRNLVLLNQSTSASEKQKIAEEIFKSKGYREANPLRESQYNYFTRWYFVVIRELAALPHFQEDPEWIAKTVNPPITAAEAAQAVKELMKLGFLVRDENGRLTSSEGWLATADEVTSAAIASYHKEMMKRASESIERVQREKRDISAQTFAVSEKTAKIIKGMIQDFRKEIEMVVSKDPEKDAVYQLNFQIFPVALGSESGKGK